MLPLCFTNIWRLDPVIFLGYGVMEVIILLLLILCRFSEPHVKWQNVLLMCGSTNNFGTFSSFFLIILIVFSARVSNALNMNKWNLPIKRFAKTKQTKKVNVYICYKYKQLEGKEAVVTHLAAWSKMWDGDMIHRPVRDTPTLSLRGIGFFLGFRQSVYVYIYIYIYSRRLFLCLHLRHLTAEQQKSTRTHKISLKVQSFQLWWTCYDFCGAIVSPLSLSLVVCDGSNNTMKISPRG